MRILIVVLYLIASGLLVGVAWNGRQAGLMSPALAAGAVHAVVGLLIVRRLYGRRAR